MQDQGTSLEPLLILVVVAIVIMVMVANMIMVFRSSGDQKKNFQNKNKTKAQDEAAVGKQIKNFQKVKVEHVIDGDTIIVSKSWNKIKIRLDSM